MNPSELERQMEPTEQEKTRLAKLLGDVPAGVGCVAVKLTDGGLPDEVTFDGNGFVEVRFVPKDKP